MKLISIGTFAREVRLSPTTRFLFNQRYGQKSKKTKKLIEEVKQNASREEDPASADA